MKKHILLFVLILLTNNISGQFIPPKMPVEYSSNDIYSTIQEGKEEFRWKKNKKKVSGIITFVCEIDGGGGIYRGYEAKGLFINGFKHGKWVETNCHTRVVSITNYNKGLITGFYKVYYEYYKPIKKSNGYRGNIKCDTILYETTFTEGNGIWKDFHENRTTVKEVGTYKDGKKDGEWLYYYPNSVLYLKQYFEKGDLIREERIEVPDECIPRITLDD